MNDDLIKYYNKELSFIRLMGAEFAEQYPKLAGNLKLSNDQIEDPHVSRLIEGFALLTANIRQKLDDSFPELTDALLGKMYPDYQAPIPSMSVIKMITENVSTSGVVLPRGSKVETHVEGIKPCFFQTCYDTKLWPLEIYAAKIQNSPFTAPKPIWKSSVKSIIKLSFKTDQKDLTMESLGVKNLRFYVNGHTEQYSKIFHLLSASCVGLAICRHKEKKALHYIESYNLQSLGFDDEHKVVPYSQNSFSAYRLLIEHYIFPEKFLFFEVKNLGELWKSIGDKFDLYIYLNKLSDDLEKKVTEENFLMGCTPIINIFTQDLEPVHIEPGQYEYKLTAKYMDAEISEVVQIESVEAYDQKDNKITVSPFYGETHPAYLAQMRMFWNCRREESSWVGGSSESGTEMYLSLVDQAFNDFSTDDEYNTWVLRIIAKCCNRNLPSQLPIGSKQTKILLPDRADIIKDILILMSPTRTIRPLLRDATRWQLINQLSLDHFSGDDGLIKLKETLRLYDFQQSPENKAVIDNIYSLELENSTARVNQKGRISFCNGTEITITFAVTQYGGSGVFFFATILDHFFAQFTAINSFTRLQMKIKGKSGIFHQWPTRSGNIPLL
ncbi:MAG: type VI secretion system baseplate subunit TssF [Psychromonas sp.]|nr:type VI secretion system baseplate subunit TssF [Psychromonas sp.]